MASLGSISANKTFVHIFLDMDVYMDTWYKLFFVQMLYKNNIALQSVVMLNIRLCCYLINTLMGNVFILIISIIHFSFCLITLVKSHFIIIIIISSLDWTMFIEIITNSFSMFCFVVSVPQRSGKHSIKTLSQEYVCSSLFCWWCVSIISKSIAYCTFWQNQPVLDYRLNC